MSALSTVGPAVALAFGDEISLVEREEHAVMGEFVSGVGVTEKNVELGRVRR